MKERKIIEIYPAIEAHMPGLHTWRALPTPYVEFLDPFLFLNHHGPDLFRPGNRGLPFGPHPHRGFETLTFILEGDILHKDSNGHESVIESGGVQWMTAGSGLIHSETSSAKFMREGGVVNILQLWMNLPAKLKFTPPAYTGLQADEIPAIAKEKSVVHLISGELFGERGPIESITDLTMSWIDFEEGAEMTIDVPSDARIFFYVESGSLEVNGRTANNRQLVNFEIAEGSVHIVTNSAARILFGFGAPFGDPIVAYGPFVMNSEDEIRKAIADFS